MSKHNADNLIRQCRLCGTVSRLTDAVLCSKNRVFCPCCGVQINKHKKNNSIQVTWALLITAAILYIPANFMPVMSVYILGTGQPDTIISGALHLLKEGQWPLALLIFVASIVVPVFKVICFGFFTD